jgi:hypothetical protein
MHFWLLKQSLFQSCRTYFRFSKWGSLNSIAVRIRVNSVQCCRYIGAASVPGQWSLPACMYAVRELCTSGGRIFRWRICQQGGSTRSQVWVNIWKCFLPRIKNLLKCPYHEICMSFLWFHYIIFWFYRLKIIFVS